MIKCPDPYMGSEQPGAPPDPSKGAQDPFGTGGESYVKYGMCPRDKPFDNDNEVMTVMGYAKLNAFDRLTHGNFFWNFRTEFEPKWDFIAATNNGWLPDNYDSESLQQIADICPRPFYELPSAAPSNPISYQSNYSGILITVSITLLFAGFYLVSTFFNRKKNNYVKIKTNSSRENEQVLDLSATKTINPTYQMTSKSIQMSV
jgi:hypothetical protein